eukprot:6966-Heterococcus_DN1.PRE.9
MAVQCLLLYSLRESASHAWLKSQRRVKVAVCIRNGDVETHYYSSCTAGCARVVIARCAM